MLIVEGLLTQEQLDSALAEQKRSGKRLGAVVRHLGFVTEEDIIRMLGKQMGILHHSLSNIIIDQSTVQLIPETLSRRHQAVPLSKSGQILTVAMVDPLNVFALDDLRSATGMDIEPVVSTEAEVLGAIDHCYGMSGSVDELLKGMTDTLSGPQNYGPQGIRKGLDRQGAESDRKAEGFASQEGGGLAPQGAAEEAPIIKLVNTLISKAVQKRASDIHVEPGENGLQIRYRLDGVLCDEMVLPKDLQAGITSRLKIMADMDIAERRIPQDGRIQVRVGEKEVDIRVSTLPVVFGEKIVMRLLDKQGILLSLEDLGLATNTLAKFQQVIRRPYGLILVVGPTGSGKTTTLYGALNQINSTEKNIVTIEDPVEYRVNRVNQVQVNAKAGVIFATGLKAILRQDPDILMIGEIRDRETASIAVQAAMTGHLVFSTLHTNDAPSAVARLIDMGVEPFLIASSLTAVVAQRLVRKVCSRCKKDYTPDPELLRGLGLEGKGQSFLHGQGCEECRNTGYSGRIGLFEILVMDEPLRHLTVSRASAADLRSQAQKAGFIQLRQDGLQKAAQKLTTLEEVLRGTQDLDS